MPSRGQREVTDKSVYRRALHGGVRGATHGTSSERRPGARHAAGACRRGGGGIAMRDPELVFKAQLAASALERAWQRWRLVHGLVADPMPAFSSYVGYSLEEPWGQPRVVLGLASSDAEHLAALLDRHDCIGPVHAMIAARSGGEGAVESGGRDDQPLLVPPQAPSMLAEQNTSGNGRSVLKPRSWRADAEDGPVYRQVAAARWASVAAAVGEAPVEEAATTTDRTVEPARDEAVTTNAAPEALLTAVTMQEPAGDQSPELAEPSQEQARQRGDAAAESAAQEQAAQQVAGQQVAGQDDAMQEEASQDGARQDEAGQDLPAACAPAGYGDSAAATTNVGTEADPGSDVVNAGDTARDVDVAVEDAAVDDEARPAVEDAATAE